MAQNYTRQSSFADGDTITASLFNNEYNQLVNAFAYSSTDVSATGHRHDGSIGQGGNIAQIGDLDFNNKIVVDGTNNRWGFFVEVAGASVEQIRLQDGVIIPVTTNDIDLGSASLQFKDAYFDGTVNADSLVLSSGTTVTAILDEDAMTSNSATALATQQSIKAYVDSQVTAQDLDFQGDSGGALSIDLDSETLTIAGGTGIDTSGAINTLTVSIDSTVATLTGTQTLTNKTLTSPDINGGAIDGAIIGATTAAAGSFTTVAASGNITVGGTVDGRDVAADGTKLDGIESGATADQTAAEIRALVEAATDSNVFTDADHTKLNGIEALADVTDTTNVTAAGALMDSELTNITAVKALNQGVATTDSPSFAGLTATTADINGGTIDGTVIGATTPAAGSFTTISASGEIAANGGVAFGDNDKATFGASDDLQIYHDGTNSYIDDAGTGNLRVRANSLELTNADYTQSYLQAVAAGSVSLFHAGNAKLATTATGIDVTGTVTADGLTVDSGATNTAATFTSTDQYSFVNFKDNTSTDGTFIGVEGNNFIVQSDSSKRLLTAAVGGDISFYKSDGSTTGVLWDASASTLDVAGTVTADGLTVDGDATVGGASGGKLSIAGQGIDAFATTTEPSIYRTGSGGSDIFAAAGHLVIQPRTSAARSVNIATSADGVSTLKRASFADNGDISFYEDTGTTAKFFWDASAESLGIGTSSPTEELTVGSGGSNYIGIGGDGVNASGIRFYRGASTVDGLIEVDANEDMIISMDNTGALGTGKILFKVGNSERARLDSSGNWLVGTTSDLTDAYMQGGGTGIALRSNDQLAVSRASSTVAQFNRNTSDGDIVSFRKGGSTVGSIGVASSYLTIGSPVGSGGHLLIGNNLVHPATSTGASKDASIDIGGSSNRFKDLYLSGGVYLGGTAAANHLDDYEEGTWTPVYVSTDGGETVTYGTRSGHYTKVGNKVTAWFSISTNSVTGGSGNIRISGLPFTIKNTNGNYGGGMFTQAAQWASAPTANPQPIINSSSIWIGGRTSINGDDAAWPWSNLKTGTSDNFLYGCVVYTVA